MVSSKFYKYIYNPKSNRWVSIHSKNGSKLLKKILLTLLGGSFICDQETLVPVDIENSSLQSEWLQLENIQNIICEENNWLDVI